MKGNVWLFSRKIDLFVLCLPVWLTWAACFMLPESILSRKPDLWFWVIFILGVDVSHVWSTIFRTYLDKGEFERHRKILIRAPLLAFTVLFLLAFLSVKLFWTVMAYVALHHFIKQQYGFMALYRLRYKEKISKRFFKDKPVIFFSMLYPVFFWHLNGIRKFNWFVNGDFLHIDKLINFLGANESFFTAVNTTGNILYWAVMAGWLIEEIYRTHRQGLPIAYGKILLMMSTGVNWYLGIVFFNSDIAFSLTNVVAHGVPYMALVFFYVLRKKQLEEPELSISPFRVLIQIAFMVLIVLLLAFGEEYFWDMFLNREKLGFFNEIIRYPFEELQSSWAQALAFAALSMPQVAHYLIDGYIWRGGPKNPHLKKVFD